MPHQREALQVQRVWETLWPYFLSNIRELVLGRSLTSAASVEKPLARALLLSHIIDFTLKRNPSNVMNVGEPLPIAHSLSNIRKVTLAKKCCEFSKYQKAFAEEHAIGERGVLQRDPLSCWKTWSKDTSCSTSDRPFCNPHASHFIYLDACNNCSWSLPKIGPFPCICHVNHSHLCAPLPSLKAFVPPTG